jgi:hypothetical protein
MANMQIDTLKEVIFSLKRQVDILTKQYEESNSELKYEIDRLKEEIQCPKD